MNWDQVVSKWEQLVGSAKENWGKLSEDESPANIRQTRAARSEDLGSLRNGKAGSREAGMGLG